MQTAEIKKLLIDLELSVADLARGCSPPVCRATVWKYFDGHLRNTRRRAQLETQLRTAAHERHVPLPADLWPQPAAPATPTTRS